MLLAVSVMAVVSLAPGSAAAAMSVACAPWPLLPAPAASPVGTGSTAVVASSSASAIGASLAISAGAVSSAASGAIGCGAALSTGASAACVDSASCASDVMSSVGVT